MKCLILADEESPQNTLPAGPMDLILSCGDLSDFHLLRTANHYGCRTVLAVRGNHDTTAPFPAPIIDLHRRTHEVGGLRFGGFGGCYRYKPRGHHLYRQGEVEQALAPFPAVDVFLAHNSPRGIHDDIREDDAHIGFRAFGAYIARHRPRFLLHGHQHLSCRTVRDGCEVIGVYGHLLLDLSFPPQNG